MKLSNIPGFNEVANAASTPYVPQAVRIPVQPSQFNFTNPGDALFGSLIGFTTLTGRYGEYTVAEIEDPKGNTWSFSCQSHALKPIQDLPVGTIVFVQFDGDRETKSGNPFRAFTVLTEADHPEYRDHFMQEVTAP